MLSMHFLSVWLGLSLFVSDTLVGATVLCEKCSDPHRFEYPGVGFDLTLDYGTSAVYFPNHSAASVAKIEGGHRYKSLMRNLAEGHDLPIEPRGNWISICLEATKRFLQQSLSQKAERWQGPITPPINAMLLALQVATEAYLETPLNTSDLAIPHGFSKSNRDLLDLELNRLGLRRTLGGYPFALKATISANDRSWNRSYFYGFEETRVVLAVDYSRSALTAALFINQNGVLDNHRFIQDVDIGADASPSSHTESEELLRKRKRLLQEVTSLPVTDAGFEIPEEISELVFIGDRAYDDELLELLEAIVGTALVAKIRATTYSDSADPIFTAVKGIASLAKQRIDEGEGSCLAWDCERS